MFSPCSEEGYRLMGAAFEVYNELGFGMAEEVYQQSLEIELALRNIPFVSKPLLSLQYKSRPIAKQYVPDLLVFSAILVELKAIKELIPDHTAQLFNYMRIAQLPCGYLINFGHPRELEWNRYVLNDLHIRRT